MVPQQVLLKSRGDSAAGWEMRAISKDREIDGSLIGSQLHIESLQPEDLPNGKFFSSIHRYGQFENVSVRVIALKLVYLVYFHSCSLILTNTTRPLTALIEPGAQFRFSYSRPARGGSNLFPIWYCYTLMGGKNVFRPGKWPEYLLEDPATTLTETYWIRRIFHV